MSDKIQYQIASADTLDKLSDMVEELIAQGWEPLGGVSIAQSWYHYESYSDGTKSGVDFTCAQAMVLKSSS